VLRLLALLSIVLMLWPDPDVHSWPAVLAFVAVAAFVGLRKLWLQNLPLWREFRASGRSASALLRDSLLLWSPLGLVILVLALVASLMATGAVSLSYRLTTIDEFCAVSELPGQPVVPCTGMAGALLPEQIRPLGAKADLDRWLAMKYRAAREPFVAAGGKSSDSHALDGPALLDSLSPVVLLGLEPAPEHDAELARLKTELRLLVDTPTKPAAGVLDLVRYVTERDARIVRMRELTARVHARREQVLRQAYDGLAPERLHPLRFGHRVARILADVPMRLDTGPSRADVVRMLAENEAAVSDRLQREFDSPVESAALAAVLDIPRYCTVASPDLDLRLDESNFEGPDAGGFIESNGGAFACFPVTGASIKLKSLGFRASVHRSIDRWHEQMALPAFRRLGALSAQARTGGGDAGAIADDLGSLVPATIHLGRQACRWNRPAGCLLNSFRESLEEGYASAHAELQQDLDAGARGSAAAADIGQRIDKLALTLDASLASQRASAHRYADGIFRSHDLLQMIGWVLLVLVAIKSFLYVLALDLFHSDEQMTIRFEGAAPIEGEYRTGAQLDIDRAFRYPLVTRKQLSNADNNLAFAPWPRAAPLARILRRKYFLFARGSLLEDAGRVPGSEGGARGMVASAGGGQSIVEWKLREGEEVIFRYKDFYGASENVQLQSEFSLRLSTMLFGRVVFHSARCQFGEGRLLLKACVEAIDQQQIRAVPMERMIAWNRHAQFTVHSGRTPWKTLINGFTLVRRDRPDGPSGLIVVSSDDGGASTGSLRYLKRIFFSIF
jgi:hypothetical protein